MEFRLVYNGPLLSANHRGGYNKAKATAIHSIRKEIHPQLKRLREVTPFLQTDPSETLPGPTPLSRVWGRLMPNQMAASLATEFQVDGFQFVPLITSEMQVACSLDILFLRNGGPGELLQAGDVDNRLKTLFDALRCPKSGHEIGDHQMEDAEQPLHCLLEDDGLITDLSVTTDRLLKPLVPDTPNDARIIITVKTKPLVLTPFNAGFF